MKLGEKTKEWLGFIVALIVGALVFGFVGWVGF